MTYSDNNTATRQEGVGAGKGNAQLRRNPARTSAEDAIELTTLAQEIEDVSDADTADEEMPVQSRRARRRASEQMEDLRESSEGKQIRHARGGADRIESNYEYSSDEADYSDDAGDEENAPRRWLGRGVRRLRSKRPEDDYEYENDELEADAADEPVHRRLTRGVMRVLRRRESDEDGIDTDAGLNEQFDEDEAPVRRRARRSDARNTATEEYADDENAAEDDEEETPTRRRLSRSPHRPMRQMGSEEEADDSINEADDEETPTRRRLSRSPHRATQRKIEDEAEQYEGDTADEEYGSEADYGDAYEDEGYQDDYEGEYEDDEAGRDERRGLSRLFKRRDTDDRYEDDVQYADAEQAPRNRFMAWLESMRIVEEIPEDEYGDEYDDYSSDVPEQASKPRNEAKSLRKVPVPQGRQRRGDVVETESPRRKSNIRKTKHDDDDHEYDYEDAPISHRSSRREPEPDAEYRAASSRTRRRAGADDEQSSKKRDDAGDEHVMDDEIHDGSDVAGVSGDSTIKDADDTLDISSAVKDEVALAKDETENNVAPHSQTDGDQPVKSDEPESDDEAHVSRRSRRTQVGSVQTAEAEQSTDADSDKDSAQDYTLLDKYKAADMKGKRAILMEYWRDQFPKRMVIPAKPEKLRELEDMVHKILEACADEYALGERWEKINQLLEQYSSAVVAEYGYKSLLNTVRSEEQQRMYGRPKDDKPEAGAAQSTVPAREPKIPAQVQQMRTESAEVESRQTDADMSNGHPNAGMTVNGSRQVPRVPAYQSHAEPARGSAERSRRDYDETDVDSREGEFIDSVNRKRRDTERDYNFDDRPRRESGSTRAKDRAHVRNAHDGEYDAGASAKGWLKQIFRRGAVLDYSSDEPQDSHDSIVEPEDELESARMDSGRDVKRQERRDNRKQDMPVRASEQSRRDYSRTDAASRSYSRIDDGGVNTREQSSGYQRSDERMANERQAPEHEDNYASRDGYPLNSGNDYGRVTESYYNGGDSGVSAEARSYPREYERADDYRPPLDRSVYDRNNADYSADRPDYSQDFADNDYMPGGYSDGFQSEYSGDYQRDGYSGDGYARSGYSSGGYSGNGYSRDGNYDAYYARPNPAGGARMDRGEREYHTRPQGGSALQSGEDAEDRWRRCSPTKDDRGEMGAPQISTTGLEGHKSRDVHNASGRIKGVVSGLIFATALADDGSDDGKAEDDARESAVGNADESTASAARKGSAVHGRRIRAGRRMRGSRKRWLLLIGTFAMLAGVMVMAYGARVVYDVRQYEGRFYEGIYLDDIALAGMTLDEAEQAVNAANEQRVTAIELKVKYGDKVYALDSSGLGIALDTADRLNELWQLGREGNYIQRHGQIMQLRDDGIREYTSYSYSASALDEFLGDIKSDVDVAPRDARIAFHPNASEKFDISGSSAGREVDITALSADARAVLAEGGGTVELAPKRLEPAFTTEQARACTVKLVTYSTKIRSSNAARTSNVRLALSFYNGLTVQPGEQVDFNKLVGNRTEARGFKPAPEYSNGEIVEGIGGGVCQASTTLYGALLRTGMRIDERYNHSMTVGYVPLSQDAAVVYPGKTLTFTNTTGYPVFFVTSVTSETATVTIYGYDIYPGKSVSIVSETLSVDKAKINTYADPNYQYTTEPGEEVMVTTPSDGVTSRAYRILIDDATGKEVSRESLGKDTYRRRDGVMYRGGE